MDSVVEKKDIIPPEIVIVDDEVDILDMLSEDLKEQGFHVACAENVSSGLALIQSFLPKLVITDLKLPLGGGTDLFQAILTLPFDVRPKVVFITGNPNFSLQDAFDQGAEGYFEKPFSKEGLITEVRRILEPMSDRWRREKKTPKPIHHIEKNVSSFHAKNGKKSVSIGRGGLFLALEGDFPKVNSIISFKIEAKDSSTPLEGDGFVRWVREFDEDDLKAGVGVEFRQLTSPSIELLENQLQVKSLTSYIPKK